MCAIVGKPLMSAYMHKKNLGQLPVLTSLTMTTGAILCRWYIVSPWICHRAEHPSSSSSPHLGQVSVSVSASKYRYRYRYRFLVSVTALLNTTLILILIHALILIITLALTNPNPNPNPIYTH